jgi:hypothetical protein
MTTKDWLLPPEEMDGLIENMVESWRYCLKSPEEWGQLFCQIASQAQAKHMVKMIKEFDEELHEFPIRNLLSAIESEE